MTGDQADLFQRLRALLPASWFPSESPTVDAVLQAPAWALSSNYAQIQYAKLQARIQTATDGWLDILSHDYFNGALPRYPNETDAAFRARIQANLFIQGPTRADLANVLTLLTGRAPLIFEPSNPADSGGWDGGLYWDVSPTGGGWGDPLPYQSLVTAYRPQGGAQDLGEWDAYTFSWDSYGAWSDAALTRVPDSAIIAAVEATRALGTVIWLRIADNPVTP